MIDERVQKLSQNDAVAGIPKIYAAATGCSVVGNGQIISVKFCAILTEDAAADVLAVLPETVMFFSFRST